MQCPTTIPSFFATLQFQSRVRPYAKAFTTEEFEVTYAEFAQAVENATRRLAMLGVPAGSRVAIMIAAPRLKWAVNIAAMRLGWAAADVSLAELPVLRADLALSDTPQQTGSVRLVQLDASWIATPPEGTPAFEEPPHDADAPCRIVMSSGTTGTPKNIKFSYGELHNRLRLAALLYGSNLTTRSMSMMGSSAVGGFNTPLLIWSTGGTVVLPSRKQAGALWELLKREPTTLLIAPSSLQSLVQELPPEWLPPQNLVLYVTGASLSPALARRTRMRLTQQVYIIYGSTEAGTVSLTHVAHAESRPGFTGHVVPWAKVEILGADGQALPPGQEGEVRVRSEELVSGYLDGEDESLRDGWFYPGDLAVLDENGGLTITGRVRELINANGVKISPSRADEVLAGLPGVEDVAAFALPSRDGVRVGIAVVAAKGFDRDAVGQRFRESFRGAPPPLIARVEKIPRNEMGKVVRHKLAESTLASLRRLDKPEA